MRIQQFERKKLPRLQKQISTSLGDVTAKEIVFDGRASFRVEFEECKRIAQEKNLPIADVYRILERELNNP